VPFPPKSVIGQAVEPAGASVDVEKVRLGQSHRGAARADLAELDDAVGIRVRQRAQEHAVDDAEHRRAGADAERQREDGGRGEPGPLAQDARAVPEVGPQNLDEPEPPDRAGVLLGQRDVPEAAQGGVPRLVGRQPCGDLLLGLELELGADLLVELGLGAAGPQAPGAIAELVPERHGYTSSGSAMIRAIAAVSCCHFEVSLVSCRRPAGLRR